MEKIVPVADRQRFQDEVTEMFNHLIYIFDLDVQPADRPRFQHFRIQICELIGEVWRRNHS